jgi:hypothetical protein
MRFVHEDPDFPRLLDLAARGTGIAAALVEKDYWVTHSLWALHASGLDLWFKGGTSLSKGFGIIERFSEDLDLMVERGTVTSLPAVGNWRSTNTGAVAQRRAFYAALASTVDIPGVLVSPADGPEDRYGRGVELHGRYPGGLLDQLVPTTSPFVRFEIGRARVVPFVERQLTSYVHEVLAERGLLSEFIDNRPHSIRCVHPVVTLIEKLDALSRRYRREPMEPDGFVRHYEDAARIIQALPTLPPTEQTAAELAAEMRDEGGIAAFPSAADPSLVLEDDERRAQVEAAHDRIAPMFWGPRVSLDEACAGIRGWIAEALE